MPVSADFLAKNTSMGTKKEYDLIPADMYQAQITDVEGIMDLPYQGDTEEPFWKVTLTILSDEEFDGPLNGPQSTRGRRLWPQVSTKLSPGGEGRNPSNAWRIASAALGHELTREELKKFDINSLIGKQLRVGVIQKTSARGTVYNRAQGFFPAKKDLPAYDPETEGFPKSREKSPF